MQVARVIGTVWATRKDNRLNGYKFMVLQPINLAENCDFGAPIISADIIGAGINETVLTVSGSSARLVTGDLSAAIDSAIIGIIDGCEMRNDAK